MGAQPWLLTFGAGGLAAGLVSFIWYVREKRRR